MLESETRLYSLSSYLLTILFNSQWQNDADRLPLLYGRQPTNVSDVVRKGPIRSDRLFQLRVTNEIQRNDRDIWDTSYYDASQGWVHENRELAITGNWAVTNGCPGAVGTARYNLCRGQGTRLNEPLRVDVRATVVSATHSNVLGVALTIATAGVTRTFTLTARDAYDNQRDETDDSFIARAVLSDGSDPGIFHSSFAPQTWWNLYLPPNSETGNPYYNQGGKYEATYAVSRSGLFQMAVSAADVGGRGLFAVYFDGTVLDNGPRLSSQVDPVVDFDWSLTSPIPNVSWSQAGFSARWAGYIKPVYSELYTFYTLTDAGARLLVNGTVIIDQLNASGQQEYMGTIFLTSGVLYDIRLEYVSGASNDRKLTLAWQSIDQVKQVVPNSQLRAASSLLQGGSLQLSVLPTVICAAASLIRGPGLTLATAGVSASFTVWNRDMYGNLRDFPTDMLITRMVPDTAETDSGVTHGGSGLQATYYDTAGFAIPLSAVPSRAVVDFSATNPSANQASLAADNSFSTRWAGLIRPTSSLVYTFKMTLSTANTDERVRLWLDNNIIIDQWSSLAQLVPSSTQSMTAARFYSIRVSYKKPGSLAASSQVKLSWNNAAATAGNDETITANMLFPCLKVSGLNNNGAACDMESKIKSQTTDNTAADQLGHGDSAASTNAYGAYKLAVAVYDGSSSNFANYLGNRNPFSYIQTRAGSHTILTSEVAYGQYDTVASAPTFATAAGTGLLATYYETPDFGNARNSYDCQMGRTCGNAISPSCGPCLTTNVDFSTTGLLGPYSLTADGSFSARWTGMIRAPYDAAATVTSTTFSAVVGSTSFDERIKLWVDNSLIIDQWSSFATSTPTAVRYWLNPNQLYDIKVEYKNVLAGTADGSTFRLKWAYGTQAAATIPSNKLFSAHLISANPTRVTINPNVAFAPACEVHGLGLTLSTAGMQASFLIQSKDAYLNLRGIGGDLFVVRAFSDGCQTLSAGGDALCDGQGGTMSPAGVSYTGANLDLPCSDQGLCAAYPPTVASLSADSLGNVNAGGSYLAEITGLSVQEPALYVVPFNGAITTLAYGTVLSIGSPVPAQLIGSGTGLFTDLAGTTVAIDLVYTCSFSLTLVTSGGFLTAVSVAGASAASSAGCTAPATYYGDLAGSVAGIVCFKVLTASNAAITAIPVATTTATTAAAKVVGVTALAAPIVSVSPGTPLLCILAFTLTIPSTAITGVTVAGSSALNSAGCVAGMTHTVTITGGATFTFTVSPSGGAVTIGSTFTGTTAVATATVINLGAAYPADVVSITPALSMLYTCGFTYTPTVANNQLTAVAITLPTANGCTTSATFQVVLVGGAAFQFATTAGGGISTTAATIVPQASTSLADGQYILSFGASLPTGITSITPAASLLGTCLLTFTLTTVSPGIVQAVSVGGNGAALNAAVTALGCNAGSYTVSLSGGATFSVTLANSAAAIASPIWAATTTQFCLRPTEPSEDQALVGATITMGGSCAAASAIVTSYSAATRSVVLATALTAAPTGGCTYKLTLSRTTTKLSAAASYDDGAYDNSYILFTSGLCSNRWTQINRYYGGGLTDVVQAATLRADTRIWMRGAVSAQASATSVTLGSPADQTLAQQTYQGMWLSIYDTNLNLLGTSKIYDYGTTQGVALLVPALSSSTGASTFVLYGWADGGRPCNSKAAGDSVSIVPQRCDTIVDTNTLSSPTYSVVGVTVTTNGAGYATNGGPFTVSCPGGQCVGSGLAGYCSTATPSGTVTASSVSSIIITSGGAGYDSVTNIQILCPQAATAPGTLVAYTIRYGLTGFTLGATSSVTDSAYVGYFASIDGTGEVIKVNSLFFK